jgi:hypothetical protein
VRFLHFEAGRARRGPSVPIPSSRITRVPRVLLQGRGAWRVSCSLVAGLRGGVSQGRPARAPLQVHNLMNARGGCSVQGWRAGSLAGRSAAPGSGYEPRPRPLRLDRQVVRLSSSSRRASTLFPRLQYLLVRVGTPSSRPPRLFQASPAPLRTGSHAWKMAYPVAPAEHVLLFPTLKPYTLHPTP